MKTLQNKQRYHFVILLRIMIFFLFTVSSVQAQIVSATGGTVTTSGLYTIHTFNSSGTFSVISGGTVEYLVIAGGGGGGGSWTTGNWTGGGGGGAGGYRSSVGGELSGGGSSAESPIILGVGAHPIVVGGGGSGGSLTNNGNNGFDSYIKNPSSVDIVRSLGGGGGAGAQWPGGVGVRRDGLAGGSGGGAAGIVSGTLPGSGTASQGYRGGTNGSVNRGSGAGGGALAIGLNGDVAGVDAYGYNYTKVHGGTGGPGVFSSITGTSIQRGGGGGGGCDETTNYLPGIGGLGGGGTGGTPTATAGTPGTANTGGGGGGGTRAAGGNGGSGIVIIRYLTAGPVPIDLLDFTAILINNKVNLNWSTATEINNDYFTVERSKDGINFEFVAKVPGAGNSTTTKQYVTLDEKPYQGISYYRLKQTDFDGKFNYSKIVYVNFKKDILKEVKIYPNPVTNELNMEIPGNTEPLNFEIISLTGAVVYKGSINEKTRVQTSSFAPGTYLIKFANDHTSGFKKVIKQ
jgi:hypothetical protein